jgi:hypothetical protein
VTLIQLVRALAYDLCPPKTELADTFAALGSSGPEGDNVNFASIEKSVTGWPRSDCDEIGTG